MKNLENPQKQKKSLTAIISENNSITKTISFASFILLMFCLFAFIINGLHRFDLLPEFLENLFYKTSDSSHAAEKDDRNIYEYLKNADDGKSGDFENGGGFTLEITAENIRDILSLIKLPDNLYIKTEARYYKDGTVSRIEEMSLWKKGAKYKYTLSVNSSPGEEYINDSKYELIINHQTGGKLIRPASKSFSFDNIPHISNINYYLDLIESGEIVNLSIRRSDDSNIAQIKYYIPQFDQREMIYISLDTGIVKRIECRTGEHGDLYYESDTQKIEAYYDGGETPEKTPLVDSLFEIR